MSNDDVKDDIDPIYQHYRQHNEGGYEDQWSKEHSEEKHCPWKTFTLHATETAEFTKLVAEISNNHKGRGQKHYTETDNPQDYTLRNVLQASAGEKIVWIEVRIPVG